MDKNQDQNTNVTYVSDEGGAPAASSFGVVMEPNEAQALSLDPTSLAQQPEAEQVTIPETHTTAVVRLLKRVDVILVLLLAIGLVGLIVANVVRKNNDNNARASNVADQYSTVTLPLDGFVVGDQGISVGASSVVINGSLKLNDGLIITPSVQPNAPKSGQLYFDQNTRQLAYYNGTAFVPLSAQSQVVNSIGGVSGALTLGGGLSIVGNQLVSEQPTVDTDKVTSIGGQQGAITIGSGLKMSGNSLQNAGVLSIAAGTNITVTNDGNGNYTVTNTGAGTGNVTTSGGTAGSIAMFDAAQNIADSLISQSGTTITVTGDLSVVTGGLSLGNALTVSNGGTGATSLTNNGVVVSHGTGAFTSVAAGGAGLCFLSTVGAPAWGACPSASGVTTLNGLSGALTVANASGAGNTITIDNATTGGAKGIASFNPTNFSAASGVVNTIQDINTTATPTFGRLSVVSGQAAAAMLFVNNTNPAATGNLLDLQLNGSSKFSVQPSGNVTSTGTFNGQTISSSANFTGTLGVTGNTTLTGTLAVNGGTINSTGALAITPGGTLTLGSSAQTVALQGGSSSTFVVTSGANTTTLSFQAPTATVTYRIPTAAAGSYDICTTAGNCAGTGGGVTTAGGSANQLAKFTGSQTIANSSISDDGVTVTTTANLSVQGGTATVGVANSQTGSLTLAYGSAAFSGTITQGALTANRTYTLPDEDGTICLSSGNCLGGGSGGANTALSNLSSVAINTSLLPGSTSIDLGSSTAPFRNLYIAGSSASPGTNNFLITGTATGARTITLPDSSGTVCLNNSTNCGFLTGTGTAFVQNGNTLGQTAVMGTTDTFGLDFITDGAVRLSLGAAGGATFSGNVAVNGSTLSSASALNITPGGTLTVGATAQTLTLQGDASSTLSATGAGFTTTVGFAGAPTGAVNYTFDRSATPGSYTICSTIGNCAGTGGGVTTAGGSTNAIAKFTGSQTLGDSSLSDDGTTVTTTGNMVIQGGDATIGVANSQTGTLILADGGANFSGSLTQGSLTANRTYTLPDASGTVCLSIGNCASGGANTALSNLSSVAINTSLLPGAAGTINLGSGTLPFQDVYLAGNSITPGSNNFRITGTATGARTITLPDASGTLCLNNSANCGFATGSGSAFVQNGNAFGGTGVLGTTDNNALNLITNNLTALALSNTGDATLTGDLAINGTTISSAAALNITPAGTLTIGATTQALTLQGNASTTLSASGGGFATTVGFTGSPTGAVNYNFDRAAAAGTYTICSTAGNCAGSGGGVTTAGGTTNAIAKFTGSQTLGDSSLSDNGTVVTATGDLVIQGGDATVGVANSQTGTLILADGSSAFSGSLTQGTLTAARTYTLPDADGTVCLSSGNCLGGGGGGANTALSNLTSVAINTSLLPGSTTIDLGSSTAPFRNLYLAGSSASPASNNFTITGTATGARTITLPDASGTVCLNNSANCGFATGSGSAFVQGGNTFGAAANLGTNDSNALNLRTNGSTALALSAVGNATFSGTVTINGATLSSAAALNITPGGTLTVGATNQALTLQGDASTTLSATGGGFTTTVGYTGTPTGAVNYNFDRAATAGTYTICTTVGNCVGSGGGVSTPGGSTNQLAKFTGSQVIGDSSISDDGTTVTTTGNLVVQGGDATLGVANSQVGTLILADGGTTFSGSLTQGTLTANRTYTLPDASGTVCLSSGNCLGGVGGGANTALSNLTGVAINTTLLPASAGTIDLGSSTLPFGVLHIAGASVTPGTNNFTITGTATAARTITLPDSTGTVCLNNAAACGFATGSGSAFVQGGNTFGAAANLGTNDSNALNLRTNGVTALALNTSGDGTLTGNLTINGTVLSSAGALSITPGSSLTVGATGQALTLQGNASTTVTATSGGFTTTVGFSGSPTANVNYNFDRSIAAGTYTICTSIGNCAGSGSGVTTTGGTAGTIAVFTGTQSVGDSLLSQSGSTVTVNGNLNLTSGHTYQINSTQISSADLSNDSNLAKLSASQTFSGATLTFQNSGTDSTNAFNIQNAAGSTLFTANTTDGSVILGDASALDGTLIFNNMTNANTVTIVPGTPTANRTITLPDASGTVCLSTGNCAGAGATLQTAYNFSVGGTTPKIKLNGTLNGVDIQDADTTIGVDLFDVRASNGGGLGSVLFGVGNTGMITLQNSANSTTALNILTQGGTRVFTVDTTNGTAVLGQSTTLNGQLVFNNSTNSNQIMLTTSAATGNRTITLPDASGTVCVSTGNCASAGGGVTTSGGTTDRLAKFTGSQTIGDSLFGDDGSTITAYGDIQFAEGSSHSLTLQGTTTNAAGNALTIGAGDAGAGASAFNGGALTLQAGSAAGTGAADGGSILIQSGNGTATGDAGNVVIKQGTGGFNTGFFQVQKSSGLPVLTVETNTSAYGGYLYLGGTVSNTAYSLTFSADTVAPDRIIGVDDSDGTDAIGDGKNLVLHAGSTSVTNANGGSIVLTAGNKNGTGIAGGVRVQNTADTSTSFQVQNAAGTETIFKVDTTARSGSGGNLVKIGNSTGTDTALTILQLDAATANPTTNLSALNGGLFYNSTTNKVSLIENGQVKIICNTTDLGCGTGTVTLQNAYTNSTGGTTSEIIADATRGALDIQDRSTSNGGTIGANLLNVRATAANDSTAGTTLFSVGNTGAVTVTSGATSLTGATSGDALTVSNSTSTGNVAVFKDNSTAVFTIADSGLVTAKSQGTSTTAFDIQNSSSVSLFSADTFNNTVHLSTVGRDNTSTFESIWLQGSKNGVTAFIGDNDDTSAYTANDFSGSLRWNGSGVAWGDFGYYPQGGGNGNNGQFRFSTTGSAVNTTPNAKVGVGDLYVAGNAGVGTNSPGYKLDVAGDVNISSGSSYRINGTAICTSSGCTPAAGSSNYIQNQSALNQTADFRISGTGRANTSIQTPLLDSASGALAIGTTNATSISLNKSTTITGNLNQGTGTVTLASNGNASLTAAGLLTLTAASASTWSTTSGNLTVQAATTNTLALQTGGAGTVGVGDVNSTTINIGRGSDIARTINIGNNSGGTTAQTVNLGSTNGASATTVAAGTGNLTLQTNAATASIIAKSGTNGYNAFQVQNATGVSQVNVNTLTTPNEILNADFEANTVNGWSLRGSATSLNTYTTPVKFGRYALGLTTASAANNGVQYNVGLKASTQYSLSLWARRSSGTSSTFNIGYAENGTDTNCLSGQTFNATYTQFTCTFTTGATIGTNANIFVKQTDTSTDDIYIDGVTLVTGATALSYQTPAGGLEVAPYYNQVTLNGSSANPELRPWQLNANQITTNGTTTAVRSRAASVAYNGYLYVLGGGTTGDGQTVVSTNNALYAKINSDGSIGSFAATTDLNTAVAASQAVVVNGYMYLVGGKTGNANNTATTIVQYAKIKSDGTLGAWSQTTSALSAARALVGLATYNGYIYVTGGADTSGNGTNTSSYAKVNSDGNITGWTSAGTLPTSPSSHGTFVNNGYIYTVGSNLFNTTAVNYAKLNADGSVGSWTANTVSLPASIGDAGFGVMNGYAYTVGGWNGANLIDSVYYAPFNTDGSIGSWTLSANKLPRIIENNRTVTYNGYMYSVGGDATVTGTTMANIYYTSGPRTQVNGALDLVGTSSFNLSDYSGGGELTAGNSNIVGTLQVQGDASFKQGLSVGAGLTVGGEINGGSYSGAGLTDCDSTNSKLLWDATTKQFSCGTDKPNVMLRKAGNQSVTSSIALVDDDTFTFTMGANETWSFQIDAVVTSDVTPDFKFGLSAPSGASCQMTVHDLYESNQGFVTACGDAGAQSIPHTDNADHPYIIWGNVRTGGTGGTVTFRWAQRVSSATSTTLHADALMYAYKMTGADLAEAYYTKDSSIGPGDIVKVDGSLAAGVQKTSGAYDSQTLGIVSTQPGNILGDPSHPMSADQRPVLLALSGRVPVKVSLENGPIEPGDYLTSSSTPGVAMKATQPGQMIGKALEGFNSPNQDSLGLVTTFANLTYADPNSGTTANNSVQGNAMTASSLNVSGTIHTQNLTVDGTATVNELVVGSMATTKELTVTGSASIGGDLNFSGVGLSRNAITKRFKASGPISIGSVVIIDPANDGQVVTTTTPSDTRVLGVALTEAAAAGDEVTVAIGGSVQVRTATGANIQGGDLLTSSAQAGLAEKSTAPLPGSLIGKALGKPDGDMTWMIITLY